MRISDWSSDVCSSDLFNANVGYLKTKIGKGESSIDLMNRTQGNPNYILSKNWIQLPSNCVIPLHVAELAAATPDVVSGLCGGVGGTLGLKKAFDPLLNKNYDPADYPELNGGAGLSTEERRVGKEGGRACRSG